MKKFISGLVLAALMASQVYAADVKISAMPAASALGGTEMIPAVQGGVNVRLNPSQINTYLGTSYQPLDSDLTAIAALTTTSTGRDVLTSADAAAIRTKAGLGTIATQAATAIAITGGAVDGTTIGLTTKSTGGFTSIINTGQTFIQNGSATNPSIVFSTDTSTGIYHDTGGIIRFSVGGTLLFTVGASGVLLPNGTAGSPSIRLDAAGVGGLYSAASNSLSVAMNSIESLRVSNTAVTAFLPIVRKGYTVSTLPSGITGGMAYVTDAVTCTFLGTLTGSGSTFCPVIYNGTAWVAE